MSRRISSSGAPSESGGEVGAAVGRTLENTAAGGAEIVHFLPDEEMNNDDVQEDNNNDEGMMMDNRVVSN